VVPEPVRALQRRLAAAGGVNYVRGYWDQNDGPRFVKWSESHDSATVAKTRHILIDPDPDDRESEARISLLHEMCHAALAARGEGAQEQYSEHGETWLAELRRVIDAGAEIMLEELETYTS
jgi:hypothetical protein